MLLAHALGVERVRLHAGPDLRVGAAEAQTFRALVGRRAAREPVQHLTGVQEFWSLPFRVTPAVLIPRPETEGILEAFLRLNHAAAPLVLDLGTGSGCLAVVAAREVPGAQVWACDLSEEALSVARDNAARHGVAERVRFRSGDLFDAFTGLGLEGRADFVLSNPPYVPEGELGGVQDEVRLYEPRAALVGGPDGLDAHRRIAAGARRFLKAGGHVIAEFGMGQEARVRALYTPPSAWPEVEVRPDLAGIPRVLVARSG